MAVEEGFGNKKHEGEDPKLFQRRDDESDDIRRLRTPRGPVRSFDYLNEERIFGAPTQDAGAISDDTSEYLDSARKLHAGFFPRPDCDESVSNAAAYNGSEGAIDSDGGDEEPYDKDDEDDDEEGHDEDELEPDLEPHFLNPAEQNMSDLSEIKDAMLRTNWSAFIEQDSWHELKEEVFMRKDCDELKGEAEEQKEQVLDP
ncbi:hypothetical protein E8E11_002926 [Didymella keratinophila]|nr:hypothetical protein E8E11_002926 [Didymella keratinophila]